MLGFFKIGSELRSWRQVWSPKKAIYRGAQSVGDACSGGDIAIYAGNSLIAEKTKALFRKEEMIGISDRHPVGKEKGASFGKNFG